jgi:hypothetical protein
MAIGEQDAKQSGSSNRETSRLLAGHYREAKSNEARE